MKIPRRVPPKASGHGVVLTLYEASGSRRLAPSAFSTEQAINVNLWSPPDNRAEMNKIRLLIASDFRLPRIGLRQIVNAVADVEVVADAEVHDSLLQKVQQLGPDVVLLELATPKANSLPAVSRLLKDKQARVVVISANQNVSYVRSMLAAGVLGYVLRDATEEELFFAIRSASAGKHFIDSQLSDGVADVLINRSKASGSANTHGLSRRERQVLTAIARGFTSQEIAEQLQISPKTVETYRSRICEKLGLKTRADLVGYAIATGLLIGSEIGDA